MKVTYNWLKDYVEIKIPPRALAEKLTMAGLEVVSLERRADDWLFEIEVTTNRPDWLSVIGIAREVAALTGKKLKLPKITKISLTANRRPQTAKPLRIEIEDKRGCSRYIGRVINNIEVRPSPDWLKKRLESVGLRPVNNIVDITNFCLLEWGQPLHAFDYAKLSGGEIIVRRARNAEKIRTIDGEEKNLDDSILVIADKTGPVALAGIMGGKDTEVNENTKAILLESAYFDPITIRRASQKLSLVTESSYRFERGVDLEAVALAAQRAQDLIIRFAQAEKDKAGKIKIEDAGIRKQKEKKVWFNSAVAPQILGLTIEPSEMERIFRALAFGVRRKAKGVFEVTVPSFRRDVGGEVDLVEEIARIYGYDEVPLTLASPKQLNGIVLEPAKPDFRKSVRETLAGLGLYEIISYSLVSAGLLERIGLPLGEGVLRIANPLSSEQEFLRPTLVASVLHAISANAKHKNTDLKIFELGDIYFKQRQAVKEEPCLAIALMGRRDFDWLRKTAQVDFYDLKGIIEAVFRKINIDDFTMEPKENPFFDSGCSVELKIKNEAVGVAGEVNKTVLSKFDLIQKIFLAELSVEKILSFVDFEKKFSPLPRYPFVFRDISFIIDTKITYYQIQEFFRQNIFGIIREIKLVDVYIGGKIPAGKKSLTFSLKCQSSQRTLQDEEIDEIEANLRQGLVEKFGAQLR
jgi:phenylalanyl-tRNA synthetase beta chain